MTVDLTHEIAVKGPPEKRCCSSRRYCPACGVDLIRWPHDPTCPRRAYERPAQEEPWRVRRPLVATAQERRSDDALEDATRRAYEAAERAGGRP